jgi:hypothetical protein
MLYQYRLYLEDGSEAGEAHYTVNINPGEIIWTGDGLAVRRASQSGGREAGVGVPRVCPYTGVQTDGQPRLSIQREDTVSRGP